MQEFLTIFCRAMLHAAVAGFVPLLTIAACSDPDPAAKSPIGACGAGGSLSAELYGGLEVVLEWDGNQLECEGMPRPNGAGARLRFAGQAGNGDDSVPLAIILGIPGLERGRTGKELPTNVTVIDEGHGRFFATQDTDSCWSDIDAQAPAAGSAKQSNEFVISGILYCVSPLAELHGTDSLRLSEVRFVGLLDWNPS